jgi:hypothetical protein
MMSIFAELRFFRSFFLFLALSILVCGCSKSGCGQYRSYIENEALRDSVVSWADQEVFSREFDEDDFNYAGLVGPGRSGAIVPERVGITVHEHLAMYEIRPIGPNYRMPEAIFIGHASFRGLIVVRESIEHSLSLTYIDPKSMTRRSGRIGHICESDR